MPNCRRIIGNDTGSFHVPEHPLPDGLDRISRLKIFYRIIDLIIEDSGRLRHCTIPLVHLQRRVQINYELELQSVIDCRHVE